MSSAATDFLSYVWNFKVASRQNGEVITHFRVILSLLKVE